MNEQTPQKTESRGYTSVNDAYQTNTIIQMRLDTSKLLGDIEAFLRGTRVIGYSEQNGVVEPVFSENGKPRMNDKGIQDTMSWLAMMLNPQTVQGNKKTDEYAEFMSNLHADLAEDLMNNLDEYNITLNDYNSILNKILSCADMFFSRTIDNLERDSYTATMRTVERNQQENGGLLSRLNPFGGN